MATGRVNYTIVDQSKHSVRDFLGLAEEAWRDMGEEGTAANASARQAGIAVGRLPKKLNQVLLIKSGAGIQSEHVEVVWVLGKMAMDVWRYVVLPHIRDVFGDRALKEEKAIGKAASGNKARKTARKKAALSPKRAVKGSGRAVNASGKSVGKQSEKVRRSRG